MALTEFQITVIRLLMENRRKSDESYIAGGAALNQILKTSRRSHDLDLFHDTSEALQSTWENDRKTLLAGGYHNSGIFLTCNIEAADTPIFMFSTSSRG
jgi:hypothetical protein